MSREHRREVRHGLARASLPYTSEVEVHSQMEWTCWAESDDGYRPAGEGEMLVSVRYLRLLPFTGENGRRYAGVRYRTDQKDARGLAGSFLRELTGLLDLARLSAEELAAEEAEDAALFEAELQEDHEALLAKELEATEGVELARALDHSMDRARRYGVEWTEDPRWIPMAGLIFRPSLDQVEETFRVYRSNVQLLEELIEAALRRKGEVEIAAKASAAAARAAFEAAMAAPAGEAKWYLMGTDPSALKFTGRTLRQGFGPKVAETNKYLPGDRSPVAIQFPGRTKRFRSEISSVGLDEVWGSLPTGVGKQDVTLMGLVADPAWSVAVRHTHDGEALEWELYTAEGITTLQAPGWDGEERWTFKGWDGEEGKGPSKAALRMAHGLTPSKEEPPPPPAPLAVPATLGGLMGKWGKKRLAGRAAGAASLAPNFQHQPGIREVKEVQHMNQEHVLKVVRALGGVRGFVSAGTLKDLEKYIPGGTALAWVQVSLKGKTPVPGWTQTGYDPGEFEVAWADRGKQLKKRDNGELGLLYGEDPEPWHYGVEQYRKTVRWEVEGLLIEVYCDGEDADNEEERDRLPLRRSRGTSSLAPSKVPSPAAISSRRRLDHAR